MDRAVQKDPAIEEEVKYRYSSVIMHYRKSFTQDNAQRVSPLSFELEATLKLARFLCSCVVLDIEGTTTPISFVTDVLFPYARDNVRMQLEETYDSVYTQEGIKLLCSQIEILHQIPHDGEVNRARHQPQHPFRIATKTTGSEVHLFYCRNHPTKYPNGGTSNPDVRLIGHTSDGFDLSSSKVNEGLLLSGSNDSRICLWDTNLTMVNNTLVWKQLL